MTDRSFVSMGMALCPYCQTPHPTGEIIMDRRLKDSLQKETIIDIKLCPECKKVCDDQDAIIIVGLTKNPSKAYVVGIRADAVRELFGEEYVTEGRVVLADPKVVKTLIDSFS